MIESEKKQRKEKKKINEQHQPVEHTKLTNRHNIIMVPKGGQREKGAEKDLKK